MALLDEQLSFESYSSLLATGSLGKAFPVSADRRKPKYGSAKVAITASGSENSSKVLMTVNRDIRRNAG